MRETVAFFGLGYFFRARVGGCGYLIHPLTTKALI